MPSEFHYRRRVTFAETDMAGICHFSNFFRYMEECEHAFFRSFGQRVHDPAGGDDLIGWARGHAECTYVRPLRYEDEVEIQLFVKEKRRKSLRYAFAMKKLVDGVPDELVATGEVVAVCCAKPPGEERMRAVEMPAAIDELVVEAEADAIAAALER